MKPRKLREYKKRVETGPVAFGSDWPGVFIRGDNALAFGWNLRNAVVKLTKYPHPSIDPITVMYLTQLADTLQSCRVGDSPE
jgi:hypothetical protein